jgi:hypothetical protein
MDLNSFAHTIGEAAEQALSKSRAAGGPYLPPTQHYQSSTTSSWWLRVRGRTIALFFRPDITRVDLRVERELVSHARELATR